MNLCIHRANVDPAARFYKRFVGCLSTFTALILLVGLGGCSVAAAHQRPPNLLSLSAAAAGPVGAGSDTLRFVIYGFNDSLETGHIPADLLEIVLYHAAEPLAIRDPSEPELWRSALAEQVQANDDLSEFTVVLRSDVMWSLPRAEADEAPEGRRLTSEDFAAALAFAHTPAGQSSTLHSDYLNVEIQVESPTVFHLHWDSPGSRNLELTMRLIPLPRWIEPLDPRLTMELQWLGTIPTVGPFQFAGWLSNGGFALERNQGFAGHLPEIRTIEVLPLRAVADEPVDQLSNTVFWVPEPMPGAQEEFESLDNFRVNRVVGPVFRTIVWNVSKEVLRGAPTRQALGAAWDMEQGFDDARRSWATGFDLLRGLVLGELGTELAAADPQELRRMLQRDSWEDAEGDAALYRDFDGVLVPLQFVACVYTNCLFATRNT